MLREVCRILLILKSDGVFGTHNDLAPVWRDISDAYFNFVSQAYFEEFWQPFVEQQELQVAVGSPFMGDRELRLPPSFSVSIYLNVAGRWGFVAPHGLAYITIDFAGLDKAVPETIEQLREEFGMDRPSSRELDQTIKTYARFMFKAKRHLIEQRPAEAYLHFIIALDLLFGDRDSLARTITKRVAILVYGKLGFSFEQAVRTVANMYDARSRYVHEGDIGRMADIQTVEAVCKEVLYCLLRLRKESKETAPANVDAWRASLDYFVTAKEADRPVPDAELRINGICVP